MTERQSSLQSEGFYKREMNFDSAVDCGTCLIVV